MWWFGEELVVFQLDILMGVLYRHHVHVLTQYVL